MALSIGQLIASTIKFNPKRSQTSIQIANMTIGIFKSPTYIVDDTPQMVRRVVMFNYVARAESDARPDLDWVKRSGKGKRPPAGGYRVFIMVPNVNIRPLKTASYPIKIGNGKFMKPVSSSTTKVKVRCDCHDFRWRFAYYDFKYGALYGVQPPPYTPVPGSNRGPVNPMKLPGVCKHILSAIKHLRASGYMN